MGQNAAVAFDAAFDQDAVLVISRDQVALVRDCVADRVVGRPVGDQDAVGAVAHGELARRVGPDHVADHRVVLAGCACDLDAVLVVARDHVGHVRAESADGVIEGVVDEYAVLAVGDEHRAGAVGADPVPHDDVACTVADDVNAALQVARDHVRGIRADPADGVATRAGQHVHEHAVEEVGNGDGAAGIRADHVPLHRVQRAADRDAVDEVAGDDVLRHGDLVAQKRDTVAAVADGEPERAEADEVVLYGVELSALFGEDAVLRVAGDDVADGREGTADRAVVRRRWSGIRRRSRWARAW